MLRNSYVSINDDATAYFSCYVSNNDEANAFNYASIVKVLWNFCINDDANALEQRMLWVSFIAKTDKRLCFFFSHKMMSMLRSFYASINDDANA
jgi:hypothetical protein